MRAFFTLLFAALFAFAPAAASAAMPGPLANLQLGLAAMSLHAPGNVAMEIKDLASGFTEGINSSASMPAASTIKIPVMVEVFHQLQEGKFDFNTTVTLRASDKDWGSGSLCDRRAGTPFAVSHLLTAMITVSDNTATNMLIRLVGREHINEEMTQMGLQHTHLGDSIRSEGNAIRWALRSSPADMVILLSHMANSDLIDEWSSKEMISILSGQQHNGLLPQPLPSGLQIAHKTGTLHDTLNDVGIVYAATTPYVIAVMTTNLPSLWAGKKFIRGVSRLAYDELTRMGDTLESAVPAATAPPATGVDETDAPMWGNNANGSSGSGEPAATEPAPSPTP
ncbi:MAG: class A beta-lactamase-related serine hydrolase [Candidatus Eremiobacteraeota bacterium]|nr:class A beta-lactamase-related serine hydrolase [Candidatus Eremiobacteraeota bacterium]